MNTVLGDRFVSFRDLKRASCLEINTCSSKEGMRNLLLHSRPNPLQNNRYIIVLGILHARKVNPNQRNEKRFSAEVAIPIDERNKATPQQVLEWLFGVSKFNPFAKSKKVPVNFLQKVSVLTFRDLANVYISVPESVMNSPITIYYPEKEKNKKHVIPPLRRQKDENGNVFPKDSIEFTPLVLPSNINEEVKKEVIKLVTQYTNASKPKEKYRILQQKLAVYDKYVPANSLEMVALMDDFINRVFEELGFPLSIFVEKGFIKFNPVYDKNTDVITTGRYNKKRVNAVNAYNSKRQLETLSRNEYEQREALLAAEAKKAAQERNKLLRALGRFAPAPSRKVVNKHLFI